MLFNSIEFAIFIPIVFLIYWFVLSKSIKAQNVFLLVASYVFYGWWDWRFLSLIAFSSSVDYLVGRQMFKSNSKKRRKLLLLISICVNLGFLGFFKYYNFFAVNFAQAFTLLGNSFEVTSLSIVLPVGISFYTFQTLSYSIDVYRKKLKPSNNIFAFFAFVSFFPQLVAGPIERATNLLPQFYKKRKFDYAQATDGMRQILWGLFKKIVIADNCAKYANLIFNNHTDYSGGTLALGAVFFAFQIYGDFSGYSDIAIGVSRLFGFNLKRNFAFPYFSRDIGEFWRRWHISLSTWFRDYLYIPLGGSRGSKLNQIRNIFIIFIVSGFWHGANWTFIVWGLLHALYFLPLMLLKMNRQNIEIVAAGGYFPSIKEVGQIIITFALSTFAWIFFRASSVEHAFDYIGRMFDGSFLTQPDVCPTTLLILLGVSLVVEWLGREGKHALHRIKSKFNLPLRWVLYFLIIASLQLFGGEQQEFIYFQF